MITPRWVRSQTQPIAVRDVLRYLVGAVELPADVSRSFEIGGPDVLTYQEMMQRYARVAGLRPRVILPINLLTPNLSSHWVNVVTPVPKAIARPLVLSLRHPSVCHEHDIAQWIPRIRPKGCCPSTMPFDWHCAESRMRTSSHGGPAPPFRGRRASCPATHCRAIPPGPAGRSSRTCASCAPAPRPSRCGPSSSASAATTAGTRRTCCGRCAASSIAWSAGWAYGEGRRDPNVLAVGDVVDFWRVEERQPPRLLRLRAEMQEPGPGLAGVLDRAARDRVQAAPASRVLPAWPRRPGALVVGAPFHAFVFPPMIRHIVERAERSGGPVRKNRPVTTSPNDDTPQPAPHPVRAVRWRAVLRFALVAAFYERVADDLILRPMYPEGDLAPAEHRLTMFLEQYWGGPKAYRTSAATRGCACAMPRSRSTQWPAIAGSCTCTTRWPSRTWPTRRRRASGSTW